MTSSQIASIATAYRFEIGRYEDAIDNFEEMCPEYAREELFIIPPKSVEFDLEDFILSVKKPGNLPNNNTKESVIKTYKAYKEAFDKVGVKKALERYIVKKVFGTNNKFNFKYTATPQQKLNRLIQIKKKLNSGNFNIFSVRNDPDVYNVGHYVNLLSNESYLNRLQSRINNYRRKVNKSNI